MRRKQGNAAQLKEQNKSPETDPKGNEYEPPDKKNSKSLSQICSTSSGKQS